MGRSRPDEADDEVPRDLDTVAFTPPRRSPRAEARRPWYVAALAFTVGAAVGAGLVVELRSPTPPAAAQPIPTTTTVVPEPVLPAPIPLRAVEPADPRGSYRATCEAEPSSGAGLGPTFVAAVVFDNRGNVGVSYEIKAVWYLPNGHDVTRSTRRDVPPGRVVRASVTIPATSAEIAANRAAAFGATCSTQVTLLSVFGDTFK